MSDFVVTQRPDACGFTLIETSLALLVIGLAFLTLLGLGRSGLDATKEASNDFRCEAMADAIFDTLETYNNLFDNFARTNQQGKTWSTLWNANPIPFPAVAGMATNTFPLIINAEKAVSTYAPKNISLNNWNPRYRLIMNSGKTSSVAHHDNIKNVILFIYPDGDTLSSDQRIFTTVINRPGVL